MLEIKECYENRLLNNVCCLCDSANDKLRGDVIMMRLLTISLAVAVLSGGCCCPKAAMLNNGDVVDSLYYHERRVEGEFMVEMWIDFTTRRLRFKCSPHDALGWESRRFDSLRLDVTLLRSELRWIEECIRLAEIETWKCVESNGAASAVDKETYYIRMKTASGAMERFVVGDEPMGFDHLREVLRFAASHPDCRYEKGERTSETNWALPYSQ